MTMMTSSYECSFINELLIDSDTRKDNIINQL